jgi:hypothetical protein
VFTRRPKSPLDWKAHGDKNISQSPTGFPQGSSKWAVNNSLPSIARNFACARSHFKHPDNFHGRMAHHPWNGFHGGPPYIHETEPRATLLIENECGLDQDILAFLKVLHNLYSARPPDWLRVRHQIACKEPQQSHNCNLNPDSAIVVPLVALPPTPLAQPIWLH